MSGRILGISIEVGRGLSGSDAAEELIGRWTLDLESRKMKQRLRMGA